jgi:colanic acid/amylovoran biosynthesis glycosyltransferase
LAQAPQALFDIAKTAGLARLPVFWPQVYRRSLADLSAIYQARTIGRPLDVDILHCQFATLAEFVMKHRQTGLLSGRVIVHFRGYDISDVIAALGPKAYDSLWGKADHFIASCEFFRQRAILLGAPPDRIDVIPSGIRIEDFPFREPLKVSRGTKVRLITIGRLIDRKGMHVILQALARSKALGLEFTLDIVGDGPERERLAKLVLELDLSADVTFHGALAHGAIRQLLEGAHILLAASLTSQSGGIDGSVNTVKEAMAVGVPVVGTRHGGIPELIEEGVTGMLAEENDVDSLVAALSRLLAARRRWPSMTAKARAHIHAHYRSEVATEALEGVYRKVLGREARYDRPRFNLRLEANGREKRS